MNGKEYISEDGIVIALPTFEQVLGFSNFYDAETYDRISPYYRNAIKNINILPIKSDPTSVDGDNDGILDIDEKWNGIDERYMNIDPLKEDTVESLYPELKKINKEQPINITVSKNNITINANIMFDKSTEESADINSTYKDKIIKGITDIWNGKYMGNLYDFYPGMDININTRIYSNSNLKNIKIFLHERAIKKNSYSLMSMYKLYIYKFKNNVSAAAAHEFGHMLKLYDAYPCNDTNNYAPMPVIFSDIAQNEIWGDYDKIDTEQAGEIMMFNGKPLLNDIEMVLQGYIDNEDQRFVPTSIPVNNEKDNVSKAIKGPKLYYKKNNYTDIYVYTIYGLININDLTDFNLLEYLNKFGIDFDESACLYWNLRRIQYE